MSGLNGSKSIITIHHIHTIHSSHYLGTLLGDQPDLAHLNDLLSGTDYEKLQFVQKKSYHIKCNWKVFIDNYLGPIRSIWDCIC
jgi:hypothetical protein